MEITELVNNFKQSVVDSLAVTQAEYDKSKEKFAEGLDKNSLRYAVEWYAEDAVYFEEMLFLLRGLLLTIEEAPSLIEMVKEIRQHRDSMMNSLLTCSLNLESTSWGSNLAGLATLKARRRYLSNISGNALLGYRFGELDKLSEEELLTFSILQE